MKKPWERLGPDHQASIQSAYREVQMSGLERAKFILAQALRLAGFRVDSQDHAVKIADELERRGKI